jgi:hypothetical protein
MNRIFIFHPVDPVILFEIHFQTSEDSQSKNKKGVAVLSRLEACPVFRPVTLRLAEIQKVRHSVRPYGND